ncbi:MAG: RNA polymerase sigma factor [Desulfobacterales bacterium]|nr:RNA polymerase sigma factor [Desulfobacterales bacterium]MDJ0884010.1 RNA polymerase sigma factor [Desulfobacterales bacterium]
MPVLSSRLDTFLAGVEKRAYRMAQMATGDREEALDIVQDAMLGLSSRYAHKTEAEWRPLFYRILQNRIRDWRRRHIVRTRWRTWLGFAGDDDSEREIDRIQQVPDHQYRPDDAAMRGLAMDALDQALGGLPLRQQQAFLLRAWEGLSVDETARAMSCSKGSVKTHYHRAIKRLRHLLEGHDDG